MGESYAFAALRQMTHRTNGYFATSPSEQQALYKAFTNVFYKLHRQTAEYLDDCQVLDSLKPIFTHFFVGVLPIQYILCILDMYTLEGHKVLYRFGITLMVLFKKEAAEKLLTISNAADWWHTLQHWTHHPMFNFEYLVRKAYGVHGGIDRQRLRFPSRNILFRIIRMEQDHIRHKMDDDKSNARLERAKPLGLVDDVAPLMESGERGKAVLAHSVEARTVIAQWLPLTLRLTNM
jgi:Rab-GTPase-TBC domain